MKEYNININYGNIYEGIQKKGNKKASIWSKDKLLWEKLIKTVTINPSIISIYYVCR